MSWKGSSYYARGFTLIELLVVISIIGMLSSIVLASLNSARNKARVASIRTQVLELRKLYAQEFSDNGSYTNLKTGWWKGSAAECDSDTGHALPASYAGSYANDAVRLCKALITTVAPYCTGTNAQCLWTADTNPNTADTFTIMVRMPDGQYLCLGSSGRNSVGAYDVTAAGCWQNP